MPRQQFLRNLRKCRGNIFEIASFFVFISLCILVLMATMRNLLMFFSFWFGLKH